MKVSLLVMTPGKMEGKSINISGPQFLIGREAQCQLRPASPLISKRHCRIDIREDRVFVRDFGSTNGTYLNEDRIENEQEALHDDILKIGPLEFRLAIEVGAAQTALNSAAPTTPIPSSSMPSTKGSHVDEAAAELLLALGDETPGDFGNIPLDSQGIPTGSTVMDVVNPSLDPSQQTQRAGGTDREKATKQAQGNTSTAAKAILEKYMRRPRASGR
jgi:pSer/pThr/pTyr-binding forkhead associated (FHA) protein